MTRGIWALCERALRCDARPIAAHLLRLLLLGAIYVALLVVVRNSLWLGAPGLTFFSALTHLNIVLPTFVGARLFSAVITTEKEDGTLPLLMLTGLSPLAILLGKSTSLLLQMLLLLVVQLPLAFFAISLGGITQGQILAAAMAVAAYLVALANVGLLASVLLRRTGDSTGVTAIWAVLYGLMGPLCVEGARNLRAYGSRVLPDALEPLVATALESASRQSVFYRVHEILQTGFTGSPWCWQVATNLLWGLGCFLLAWGLFPLANRNPATETTPRRLLAIRSPQAWRTAGRPWNNALIWKAFHFDAGGLPGIGLKFAGYAVFVPLIAWTQTDGFLRPMRPEELLPGWAGVITVLLVIEAISHAGRVFQVEYQAAAWSTLLTLPRSTAYLGYSKVGGLLLAMLPGAIFCGVLWLLASLSGRRYVRSALQDAEFWTVMLFIAWIIHLIAWLSAYRQQAQALVRLAGGLIVAVLVGVICSLVNWQRLGLSENFFLMVFNLVMMTTAAAMHWSMGIQLSRDDAA